MQETRPPEANLKAAFSGSPSNVHAIKALEVEIQRVSVLKPDNKANLAKARRVINEASDAIQKLTRASKKANLAFKQLRAIK